MNFVKKSDIPALKKMFDENFGQGYMSEEKMKYYINNEKELFYASRAADRALTGILLFGPESPEIISEQTRIPMEKLSEMSGGKEILKCRSMCISSEFQKQGIGEKLFSDAVADIKNTGEYGLITSMLWEYDGKASARKIHEDNDFRFLYRLKEPWYSLEDYYCVFCKGRCRCDGLLYVLKLAAGPCS